MISRLYRRGCPRGSTYNGLQSTNRNWGPHSVHLSIPSGRDSGSWPLLVMEGKAWDTPYISPGETRPGNRVRLLRGHASTAPADQRWVTLHPLPRCVLRLRTLEDTPTVAVWTMRLRGLGCGGGRYRLPLGWRQGLSPV